MTTRPRRSSMWLPATTAVLAACFLVLQPLASAQNQVVATWRGTDVVVDGSIADWSSLVRAGEGPAIAVQNDDDNLTLVVASNDPEVRLQLATGLIVWLDRTGRRQQTFGLRLEGLAPRPLAGGTPTTTRDAIPDRVLNSLDAFDLLGPARLQRRLIDDPAPLGFTLASGVENDTIAYEMQLPLRKGADRPHAVDAEPGSLVSLGIETPPDLRRSRERSRLDNPMSTSPWVQDPWGYGGYFTTPPPPPGGRPKPPPELEAMRLLWTTVRLATRP